MSYKINNFNEKEKQNKIKYFLPILTKFKLNEELNFSLSNSSITQPKSNLSCSSQSTISVDNSIECKHQSIDASWSNSKSLFFLKQNFNLNKTLNNFFQIEFDFNNLKKKKLNLNSDMLNSNLQKKKLIQNQTNLNFKYKSLTNLDLNCSLSCQLFDGSFTLPINSKRFRQNICETYFYENKYVSTKNDLFQELNQNRLNKFCDELELDKYKLLNPNNNSLQINNNLNYLKKSNEKKFTKIQKITLFCILIVSFSSYCCMSVIAPFFPKKAFDKGLNNTEAGFVFSVFALVSFVCSPFLGKLIACSGAKFMLLFGIFIGGLSNLMFGFIDNIENPKLFFYLCILIRILESFGTCCHATASYTYVIKLFPNSIGFVFGLTETFVGMGSCLGPGIGGFLFALGGYKLPFYVFGTILLICLPLNWILLESIGKIADKISINESKRSLESIKTTYWKILRINEIMVISLVIIVMSICQSFLEPTVEPHFRKFNFQPEMIAVEFLLCSIAYAISTPVVGYLSTKIKNKFLIMLNGTMITILGLLIVGPCKMIYFIKPNAWISTIGLILISFGHGIAFIPTFEAVFQCCLKAGFAHNVKTYGKVSGLWSCLFSLGEVIGPSLGGFITYYYDFQEASTFIALICIFILPFISVMYFKSKQEINLENNLDSKTKDGIQEYQENNLIFQNQISNLQHI